MDRKEVGITEEAERFLKFLDLLGEFLLGSLCLLGIAFFISGFRFLNPLDTIVRFAFGGFIAAATSYHFIRKYQRWRMKKTIMKRLME